MAASLFFPGFVVLANYIMMQLIVAAMLEYLKDPARKAAESAQFLRTRSKRLLPLADDVVVYWYSFSNHYTKCAFTQP